MKIGKYSVPEVRKAVVAWIGFVVTLTGAAVAQASDAIPADAAAWIGVGIAGATGVAVFLVKNGEAIDDASDGTIDGKYTPKS